jgi:hypothetical protein
MYNYDSNGVNHNVITHYNINPPTGAYFISHGLNVITVDMKSIHFQ